jgi:cobaltochelatase CobT
LYVDDSWTYASILVLLGLISWKSVLEWRRRRPIKDSPDGTPYKIYTTEFDKVLTSAELPKKLDSSSPDAEKGFLKHDRLEWDQAISEAEQTLKTLHQNLSKSSSSLSLIGDTAIVFLVDQSGSMKGQPMASTVAGLIQLTQLLVRRGTKTEIIGFTTAGWQGGFARRQWSESKRPQRPGRLCALMHIIYKSFDQVDLNEHSWHQMLNPDILRENIDGEALEFAESRLLARSESRRILMIISDGAPVDDSTLTQNGPSFLYRHVTAVISRIQYDAKIELYAIGVNFSVSEFYEYSVRADDAKSLVDEAIKFLELQGH